MKRKYFLKKAITKARLSRLLAKSIDLFIVLILSVFFHPVGLILAVAYLAVADSLQEGQSVGKKFIGFAVISLEDGRPCTIKQSVIRNLPLLIPLGFAIIPLWGILISLVLGLPLGLLELYFIFKLDSGHRLGDVMADTSVMANDGTQSTLKSPKTGWFEEASQPST
jgi:uncharacterized RDD family membrane protein YckC